MYDDGYFLLITTIEVIITLTSLPSYGSFLHVHVPFMDWKTSSLGMLVGLPGLWFILFLRNSIRLTLLIVKDV